MPYAKRKCVECEKVFQPSSRHKSCPTCRDLKRRMPCPECGQPMYYRSAMCRSCLPMAGSKNPRWKNGESRHAKGYVLIRQVGHPRRTNTGSYVFEHILVMEERLGRYLLPGENVHHINGVKHDNRDSNLELWVKPQPSGIRAEDAVEWAKEVLKRYDPDSLTRG